MTGAAKKRAKSEKGQPKPQSEASRQVEAIPQHGGAGDQMTVGDSSSISAPNKLEVSHGRVDLGITNYTALTGETSKSLCARPQRPNQQGREANIALNSFDVLQFPTARIYQYDILIGSGVEKRIVIRKIWECATVRRALGEGWIFDGNRIAWSLNKGMEFNEIIDLDVEQGRPAREMETNRFRVTIRPGKPGSDALEKKEGCHFIRMDMLEAYLERQTTDFTTYQLEAISFLDHLLRETPSTTMIPFKRSFFFRGERREDMGLSVEAFKGVFASIQMVHSMGRPTCSVLVDVANGLFWKENELIHVIQQLMKARTLSDLKQLFARDRGVGWERSPFYHACKRLKRVSVFVSHRGRKDARGLVIHDILDCTPREYKFTERLFRDGKPMLGKDGKPITQETSIFKYFEQKYEIMLDDDLPVIQMTKKNVVMPLEVVVIDKAQRYPYKLNEEQTRNMMKFAVTLPNERWKAIETGVQKLDWARDKYLKHYGLKIKPQRTVVKARILPAPSVQFATDAVLPRDTSQGRWRLIGKKFVAKPDRALASWGVCVVTTNYKWQDIPDAAVRTFFDKFVQIYQKHGGLMAATPANPTRKLVIQKIHVGLGGDMIRTIWNTIGNANNMRPQLIFFVVPDRSSDVYLRIKKSTDIRYGVASQVLQSQHVQKAADQYISNVCMKVHAKLGGQVSRAAGNLLPKMSALDLRNSTMIIGADVSHAAPGSDQGSMAAFTVSMDKDCARYVARCETNGRRVEIISTWNVMHLLGPMTEMWPQKVGQGKLPRRVIYIRDGVSVGEYQRVLSQEVADIKRMFRDKYPTNPAAQNMPMTVIIATKRHHVRFFPERGDRTGNPFPGTLVESGVTHPFEFDFYLCSHQAIKGTARPVHYHVLINECNIGSEELQQMLFEHSFQYCRSTTPVSLHPAVYYAHLASNRAKAHEDKPAVSSGKKGPHGEAPPGPTLAEQKILRKQAEDKARAEGKPIPPPDTMTGNSKDKGTSKRELGEIGPLMTLNASGGLHECMWFV